MKSIFRKVAAAAFVIALAALPACSAYKGSSSLGSSKTSSSSSSSSKKTSSKTTTNSGSKTNSKSNSKTTTTTTTTVAADKKYGTASVAATKGATQKGQASYYGDKLHGNKTASGEKYDKSKMTCAHRTLPFGTMVKVTRTDNGKSVTCKVNDRGPFKNGRIVDVSGAAATKLDMKKVGVCAVTLEVVSVP